MGSRRLVRWGLIAAALAVLCYFFPLFHIVRVGDAAAEKIDSAADYLEQLWAKDLPASHGRAIDVVELVTALAADPQTATFGRKVGLSDTRFYFARGTGQITELSGAKAMLRIEGIDASVCLKLGILTGSAVRDAPGLVDVNRFARLQDFNALSGQLNEKVEAEVIGPIREQLAEGARVAFVGCAQVKGPRDLSPLCLTPVSLKIVDEATP